MSKVKAEVIDAFVIEFKCPECEAEASDVQSKLSGSMSWTCDECENEFEVEWE